MTRLKDVLLSFGPLSVTVIEFVPAEALAAAVIVRATSQVEPVVAGGVQEDGEKDALTPSGRPVTLEDAKETAEGVPETLLTRTVWFPENP